MMPVGTIAILSGEPVRHEVVADSGARVFREFCGRCGTQLFSGSTAFPQSRTVKIAALDDPARVAPVAHVWTQSRIAWACIEDGLPRFPGNTDMAVLERLWNERASTQ